MREPDDLELELALQAIITMDSRARPYPSMRRHCLVRNEHVTIYVNLRDPEELPEGSVYVTWVVDIRAGAVTSTAYFLSRRGTDETLPPVPLSKLEHL